jgi:hypothetical protein
MGCLSPPLRRSVVSDERNWSHRDDYALRSMAQTRAVAKALRLCLGWIMSLAGYEATPAEEMPCGSRAHPLRPKPKSPR